MSKGFDAGGKAPAKTQEVSRSPMVPADRARPEAGNRKGPADPETRLQRAGRLGHSPERLLKAGAFSPVQRNVVQRLKAACIRDDGGKFELNVGPTGAAIGQLGGREHGRATFEVVTKSDGKVMVLHTISSTPEEGTGFGSLLLYYMAKQAVDMGCTSIEIEDPALPAVAFYEHMGARANKPELVEEFANIFSGKPAAKPADAKAAEAKASDAKAAAAQPSELEVFARTLDDLAGEAAMRAHEKAEFNSKDYVKFSQLPVERQTALKDAKKLEFAAFDPTKKAELVRERLRVRAVSATGSMLADPREMFKKAGDSATKRWKVKEEAPPAAAKKACFLTTACVEAVGLPDDCQELTVLRGFRDGWLQDQPGGPALIEEYYRIAPPIVEALMREERSQERFRDLYDDLVVPAVRLILAQRFEDALSHYRLVVQNLADRRDASTPPRSEDEASDIR